MLRVVYEVLACIPHYPDILANLGVVKMFVASNIDPVIEANGGVPVSSTRDVVKEKHQLALIESIKSMQPTYHAWDWKLITFVV